ncbi:MAG: EAL domain-containing protein [Gemmatimonadetes bacterium]|nr:EAL domain-containing protein [Gemmatimonadota bacterium]
MTPVSILILLILSAAAGWSGYLVVRTAEGRLRLLAGVVGLVVLGYLIPLIVAIESWTIRWTFAPAELLGLGMAAAGLLGLGLLDRVTSGHHQVSRQLGLQNAFLQELFDTSAEAIVLLDAEGRALKANPAFTAIFGYDSGELAGQLVHELIVPEDGLEQAARMIKTVLGGKKVERESVLRRKDGSQLNTSILGAPMRMVDGPIAGFTMYRDITGLKRAEDAFRQMEKAVETMQLGVTVTDLQGRIVYTNPADAAMHGYTPKELLGKDVHVFAAPGSPQQLTFEQLEELQTWRRDSVNVRKDGVQFPVHLISDVVRDAANNPIGIVTTCDDITQRQVAERALRESEERYALALRGANDGLWDWNLETDEVYYSDRWKSMLGYGDSEIESRPEAWLDRVHGEDIGRVKAALAAHRQDRSPHFEDEHRILGKDGEYHWVLARGIAERDPDGKPYRIAGSLTDISQRKKVEEQMAQEALYDPLTGLPNRAFLTDLLRRAFRRTKRRKEYRFAVLFVDLDRFKVVNDSLGHAAGDQLLVEIARRLQDCLRPGDVVARLGGDEFCVLLDELKDSSDTTRVAERIQTGLKVPVELDNRQVFITASIGIAVSAEGLDGPEHLLRHADTAMYRAKARGKARYEIFDKAMHERAVAMLQLEADLREAVDQQQFHLVYQPVVTIETGKISGFEALVRWEHPERGTIGPAAFVPLAEETGLIVPLGNWILLEACRQMAEWAKLFPSMSSVTISVNLSHMQLRQPDLVDRVQQAIRETGLSAERLKLEVAEMVLMDEPEANIQVIHRLRDLGVRVQMDDFGTGSSSLSYLNRFRVDTLKIDRSFISRVGAPGEKAAMVQAMITLARELGIRVIAEGVETKQQSEKLITLNCEQAQGYLYSQPLIAAEAQALLQAEVAA